MYIGIDLGTSGVKAILLSANGEILASATTAMTVSRPKPLWSEQDPKQWWDATLNSLSELGKQHSLQQVQAIGLSGQMHGVTLLDGANQVLRPAILWNDGRCEQECLELEQLVPESRDITGNLMMPGFSAPKLKWLAKHEPECFTRVAKVLLPKDYLRFLLSGDFATDMSDAAGTMWLDVGMRDWSDEMLSACGLNRSQMPTLFEGNQITGTLNQELAQQLGMACVPVVAGGGDNAAGAVGVGIVKPGQAMISLGTSGVYFAVSQGFTTNPAAALHSFCHALPGTWHTMSVILSAASCLDWVARMTGFSAVPAMMQALEAQQPQTDVIFLPYLSGERTPHNNPNAKGVFFGLTHNTTPLHMAQAVLEGVGFALQDGLDALHMTGDVPDNITLIGGGARSAYWRQLLTDIFNTELVYREGGDVGPALGAARLAQLAIEGKQAAVEQICAQPRVLQTHTPNPEIHQQLAVKRQTYISLYRQLKPLFKA
ncbi:xylulokinase [Vibrio sp. ABG19]|uniref:xylulokinase n=1 Tax=Vibrio sp. ABG19 TaxID=2817385 RepID=UPI00249E8A6C|nr:xylulokinase [Vibrio sp. ABG19]WGY47140.1 xylulokinase [Vibrio sp. ABG19]